MPQALPAIFLSTDPSALTTSMSNSYSIFVNAAETDFAASIVTVQVGEVPQIGKDQPSNSEPVAATAVRVTTSPVTNEPVHRDPQSTPTGSEVNIPEPVPVVPVVKK